VFILQRDGKEPTRLEAIGMKRLDARLVEVTLRTPAVRGPTRVRVLLPARYERTKRRYPVLYLLHGATQDYRRWTDSGPVSRLTRRLPLIVVMPDGGRLGFYSNWFNGGDHGPPMWETYHIDQLVPWIDSEFRTRREKDGRAIAGSSMGGFGALSYAARHPDLFAAAASFSGPVDTGYPPLVRPLERLSPEEEGEPAIWGARSGHEALWRAHNPFDLASRLRSVRVLLFSGNGQRGGPFGGGPDPREAAIHATNVRLDARLSQLGIPHHWSDYGPGIHSVAYFNRDLAWSLPMLMRTLRSPRVGGASEAVSRAPG
jgi:S-formylglutathione hydrolase FrmB